MKTIYLEVDDSSYQAILNFIKLLPENRCRVLEGDELSKEEKQHIDQCVAQIELDDLSEFEDFEIVKQQL